MINTTIQCWLIVTHFHGEYICFDGHSQNPSHTFPHEKPWVCLRSLKKNPQKSASSGFPMGKNKNIFIKSRKITDEIPTSLISAGCQHVAPDVAKAAEPERLRVVPSWHCESVRACATAQLDPAEILLLSGKNIRIY
jgi:hypothetical protein